MQKMNMLCFASNLTSSEWAAWVQAFGSITAIVGSVLLAIWQTGKQYKNALEIQRSDQANSRIELTKTLSVLAESCANAIANLKKMLKDRETVHNIVDGNIYFDLGELARLDVAVIGIPLHDLPSRLVKPTLFLSSDIRQFRQNVEHVFLTHRAMDAKAFQEFFQILDAIANSIGRTADEITREVEHAQSHVN
jgi:hypothetical protein